MGEDSSLSTNLKSFECELDFALSDFLAPILLKLLFRRPSTSCREPEHFSKCTRSHLHASFLLHQVHPGVEGAGEAGRHEERAMLLLANTSSERKAQSEY
jgi:hypothetical protein